VTVPGPIPGDLTILWRPALFVLIVVVVGVPESILRSPHYVSLQPL
jgi:hypothetical protein